MPEISRKLDKIRNSLARIFSLFGSILTFVVSITANGDCMGRIPQGMPSTECYALYFYSIFSIL